MSRLKNLQDRLGLDSLSLLESRSVKTVLGGYKEGLSRRGSDQAVYRGELDGGVGRFEQTERHRGSRRAKGLGRLSPAGDGAEGVGGACEQQKSSAWWIGCFSRWFGSATFCVRN